MFKRNFLTTILLAVLVIFAVSFSCSAANTITIDDVSFEKILDESGDETDDIKMTIEFTAPAGTNQITLCVLGENIVNISEAYKNNTLIHLDQFDNVTENSLTVTLGKDRVLTATDENNVDAATIYIRMGGNDIIQTGFKAAKIGSVGKEFSGSMQAYLNLESIVTMTVGYKFENMTGVNPEEHFDRLGLLIWDAAEVPSDKEATYENCTNIIEGARYNKKDARFETTTEGIAAKELGDSFAFRAYYLNDDGTYSYSKLIASYSPKKYCYSQIDKKPDDKENIALMSGILNYGAEAQKYFDYKIDNLMNSELTEEQKQVKWSEDLVRSDYSVPDDKDAGFVRDKSVVTSLGGYLNLEGAIDYNFYAKVNFTPKNATIYYWTEDAVNELDVLTLENATSSEKLTWKNSRYEGKYEGQPAKEMFRTIYALLVFEREDGTIETSGVVGYSPERYCFINKDKGDKNEFLSKALVVYGDAAIAYFNR